MATFACVSLPAQFITPPPSSLTCIQNNDSDSGSSTGTSSGGMKAHETSDEGSTSSQQTPPEYPSPPPPSNSPPESMESLQAESPIGDEETHGTGGSQPSNEETSSSSGEYVNSQGVKVWMAQPGFHAVPLGGGLPRGPQSILFVHVNDGEHLQLKGGGDHEVIGNLPGPGTVRMIGEPGMINQPLPIQLRDNQQCHQFVDEEGNLRHVVLSVASPDSGSQNSQELNVPHLIGPKQLMNAMNGGVAPRGGQGPSRGGNRGNHGNGRGNNNNNHYNNNRNGQANGYNRGNYRGNKPHGGRGGRDYQGQNRGESSNFVPAPVNGVPELPVAVNLPLDISHHQPVPPEVNGTVQPQIPPPVVSESGETSLLGEPNVPPMADLAMRMQGPPMCLPQQQVSQQPVLPMMITHLSDLQMADIPIQVIPTIVNNTLPNGLMQEAMMPGTSIGMPPQQLGFNAHLIPPQGLPQMLLPQLPPKFNNNNTKYAGYHEDNERLKEILTKALKCPVVANSLPTEAQFMWMPIKISDHRFKNGICQFSNVEQSDITYHASVYDFFGVLVNQYLVVEVKCDENQIVSNVFQAHTLHPNSSYQITIKACILNRDLEGETTPFVPFRTAPGRPEPPNKIEITSRGTHHLIISWFPSINNGAFVSMYHVYIQENEFEQARMLQTSEERIHITNLAPHTCYKITINSVNALGESLTGASFEAWTRTNIKPSPPENIAASAQSHRSIRISWENNPNNYFWVELYNCNTMVGGYVRERFIGNSTVVGDLEPDTDYQIRVTSRNEFGEGLSGWLFARTQKIRRLDNPNYRGRHYNEDGVGNNHRQSVPNYDRPPSNPSFNRYVDNCPEMSWRSFGPGQREHTFIVEGSTFEAPERFNQLYRGNATTYIVLDETIHYIRCYIIHRKGQRSSTTDRVVVPREYNKFKPETVTGVVCAQRDHQSVKVSWLALQRENSRVPQSAIVRYYVQRSDLSDNAVVNVGEDTHFVYNSIPGEAKITVQVRAAAVFHGEIIYGDWSKPVDFKMPRSLPPPVENIEFDSKTSLLTWDCKDQSNDLSFSVQIDQLQSRKMCMKMTTKSRNLVLDCVQPGEEYVAIIYSVTSVGSSTRNSTLDFAVPALKPGVPSDIAVPFIQIDKCTVVWKHAEPRGSPVLGYSVQMMLNSKLYREHFVDNQIEEDSLRFTVKNLTPNTEYLAKVAAKNSVGYGDFAEFLFQTKPLPPVVPKIMCDREANSLRIHWELDKTSSDIQYKINRVNRNGQHQALYEGEQNTVKIRNLAENTEYAFKMRVLNRATGASVWSDEFYFTTKTAPPPPVKVMPVASLITGESYLYRVEWKECLPANSPHKQFYRLQIVDATVQGAKWQTAYEGKATKYDLNTEEFPGALHVRVLCVREQEDGELKGAPSPVGYIGNIPPPVEPVKVEEDQPGNAIYRFFTGHSSPITIAGVFFLIAIFCLSFSEYLFVWISGEPVKIKGTGPPAAVPTQMMKPPQ